TGGHSVWWTWTAPSSSRVSVDTIGSNFDTTLGVYTGSAVTGLTTVASDNDSGGNDTSRLTFTATAGTTYRIAVDGFGGATGNITLHLATLGPANDNFASASSLSGGSATASGSNVGATK